ncbi:hypothetical protein AVEN_208430-1 [Araneus ventricosus]|uniref:Uncharacterized protein n=1 Tax=Araneus ventricosus TaxID=182803 RepID=A0A4Y2EG75_ARAVE|nr:hypothetical protein AVEN_208430-1 [Araneus ventricosus]
MNLHFPYEGGPIKKVWDLFLSPPDGAATLMLQRLDVTEGKKKESEVERGRYCPTARRKTLEGVATIRRVEERRETGIKSTATFGEHCTLR